MGWVGLGLILGLVLDLAWFGLGFGLSFVLVLGLVSFGLVLVLVWLLSQDQNPASGPPRQAPGTLRSANHEAWSRFGKALQKEVAPNALLTAIIKPRRVPGGSRGPSGELEMSLGRGKNEAWRRFGKSSKKKVAT